MTQKIFAPLSAVAFMAILAVSLVVTGGTASATVNGISVSSATVNADGQSTLTIDTNEGDGDVRILATAGDFESCLADGVACVLAGATVLENDADADIDFTVTQAGNTLDTLSVLWEAPATGPQTVTFTVIQGSSTKTASVTVRGTPATVEVSAFTGASTSLTTCAGTVANVIQSTTATAGQANAILCTIVLDSAGNRLPNQAVVYSTTAGTIAPLTDTTGATGQRANASVLTAGSTGTSGSEATITASAGGKTATTTVKFGGDPASCTVTTNPTTVTVGGSSIVTVTGLDSTSGPVPDGQVFNVAQANSGQGANAAILNPNPTTLNGIAKTTAIAAIQGAIALGASSGVAGNDTSCTGTLLASGQVTPPVGGGTGTGDGTFASAPTFGSGDVGSAVFNGGTIAQLSAAVTASGGTAVWVQGTDGNWYRYNTLATGATAFVNNAFIAQFSGGMGTTAVFVVK